MVAEKRLASLSSLVEQNLLNRVELLNDIDLQCRVGVAPLIARLTYSVMVSIGRKAIQVTNSSVDAYLFKLPG